MATATNVTQLPPPRRTRRAAPAPQPRQRAKPTEVQRNARTIYGRQSKLASLQHAQTLAEMGTRRKYGRQEISQKGRVKVQTARQIVPLQEGSAIRVIQARGTSKVATEGQIAGIRTQQRIIQQKAAEHERTKGYLIRHTGSRAITTAGSALRPSVNPISLVIMISMGLIVFYLLVAHGKNTGDFFGRMSDAVTTLSSTKPLFTRES